MRRFSKGTFAGFFGRPVNDELGAPYRHADHPELIVEDKFQSVGEMFDDSCSKFGDEECLGKRSVIEREYVVDSTTNNKLEKLVLSDYKFMTYNEVKKHRDWFGNALLSLGINPGEMLLIFMETCIDWMITCQASFAYNMPIATIYATLGPESLVYSINQIDTKVLLTEQKQLSIIKTIISSISCIKYIVYTPSYEIDASPDDLEGFPDSIQLIPYVKMYEIGKKLEEEGKFKSRIEVATINLKDVALIMYTSGSTGMPKGVMISHENMLGFLVGVKASVPDIGVGDRYIGYLPLAHILELAAENYVLRVGAAIGYGSPGTLADFSPRIRAGTKGDTTALIPTIMTCVPAIMDRIKKGVISKVANSSIVVRMLFNTAFNLKLANVKAIGSYSSWWDYVVFNKIKGMLGGKVRMILSGGAPLSQETQLFMRVVFGIPIAQGYGLTETVGGATICNFRDISNGNVGGPIACCQLKLVDWEEGGYRNSDINDPKIGCSRGEIVIGGANVSMGYYRGKNNTYDESLASLDESFKVDEDGVRWFYTGDIGQWLPSGCLQIIDRKKDLVKLQAGEYVSLGKVESIMKGSKYVEMCCVYADPLTTYCIALIIPSVPEILRLAKTISSLEGKYEESKISEIYNNKDIVSAVLQDVCSVSKKAKLHKFEIPAKIYICSEQWTPENEMVTAALKLKRTNIVQHYADVIKDIYSS